MLTRLLLAESGPLRYLRVILLAVPSLLLFLLLGEPA
jgi:hypothetical protein